MESPDYIVDIESLKRRGAGDDQANGDGKRVGRPWLAVHWRCCQVYSRVYRDHDATAYEGRCPSCGRRVVARVGEGGVSSRFFEAG